MTSFWTARDGVRIAWREMGEGRPLFLIHGYVSNAENNWIKYGTAQALADAGFRCIMPDLRAHGESDKPHDPALYLPDILADDMLGLIAHLGLTDYDLAGYSLGARTAVRMLVKRATPRRAIISGMGLAGVTTTGNRKDFFRTVMRNIGQHERGSPAFMAEAFLKTTGGDPIALDLILDSFVDTSLDELAVLDRPTAVICGSQDQDNGSAEDLTSALADARYIPIPGNHMSAVTKPDLASAMIAFLSA